MYCGPGNNGGDGLVCARHLHLYGYQPVVFYPKRTDKELYRNLAHQCEAMGVPLLQATPSLEDVNSQYSILIDAIFGFSFRPPVRKDFLEIMDIMKKTSIPVASIDIPSGWDVENGPAEDDLKPDLLISLTAPKKCAQFFNGNHHYLGGRFVPPALHEKYEMNLPPYPGTEIVVQI